MVSPSKKSQSADGWMAFYPFNSIFPPPLVLSGMLRTVPIYRCSLMREEDWKAEHWLQSQKHHQGYKEGRSSSSSSAAQCDMMMHVACSANRNVDQTQTQIKSLPYMRTRIPRLCALSRSHEATEDRPPREDYKQEMWGYFKCHLRERWKFHRSVYDKHSHQSGGPSLKRRQGLRPIEENYRDIYFQIEEV